MSDPRLRPSCAPRKMLPIDILYLNADNNVIKGKLLNMKVQSCGCTFAKNNEYEYEYEYE